MKWCMKQTTAEHFRNILPNMIPDVYVKGTLKGTHLRELEYISMVTDGWEYPILNTGEHSAQSNIF